MNKELYLCLILEYNTTVTRTNMEISEKIKFVELCDILQKIENTNVIKEKEIILQKFIKKFKNLKQTYAKEHENNIDNTFYCILRILIPSADKTRKSYGIQINTLGKIITKIVGLPGNDAEMFNFNNNEKKDFANKLYSIMINRANAKPSNLSIKEIHNILDIVANEQRRKIEEELIKFIENTSALEQKWLIRIILKNLKIGMGEYKIFQLYHQHGKDLYLRHGNLQKVCNMVESGEEINFKNDDVTLFQYIHPMLCERLVITKVEKLFNNNITYFLETKWDGERFQIHIEDGNYKYISRNGIDYTTTYGKNIHEGNLTPFLNKLFKLKIKNLIIDGEMMVWDKSKSSYRIKGENFDVKNLQIGGNLRPCFVAYDLLYLNDVLYIDRSYTERINNLNKIFQESPGIFQFCKRTKIYNSEQFIEHFNATISDKEEGIVIKNQNSIYKPGKRNKTGWYKLKPDYVEGVISDFDLLIIGGYYGRGNIVESYKYLLGVSKKNENSEELKFLSICTVSSGLSYNEKEKLKNLLSKHWQNDAPVNVEFGEEKPDVYIEPKNSIILQIRGTEIYRSSNFKTIYTLRFPRIQAIRNDKTSTDCMEIQEFENFYNNDSKVQKIHKRQLTNQDLLPIEKKRKFNHGNPYISNIERNESQPITTTFEGIDFCILNGFNNDKENLKRIILKHSGRIVANPSLDTKKSICITMDQQSFSVKKLKQTKLYNIIHADWLKRCFSEDKLLCKGNSMKPKLRDIIYATSDIEKILNKTFDQYGDSYTDHIDLEELQIILNYLKPEQIKPLSVTEIVNIENELYNNNDNPNIFRNIYGFFDIGIYKENTNLTNLAILKFSAKGGIVINQNELKTISVPVIIFYDVDYKLLSIKSWLQNTFENNIQTSIRFVPYNWILDCDSCNKHIDIEKYI